MSEDLEKSTVSIKTVVGIVIGIVSWALSLAGTYFAMEAKVNEAQKTAIETKKRLDEFNPDIIAYRVNELSEQVKKSNDKADAILELLSR